MRRRGSMLEMRGAQGSQGSQGTGSLSGSDNSINSAPARRSTVTRRSFGDPPPLPGKKAVIVNPLSRGGIPVAAAAPPRPAVASTPSTSAAATPTRSTTSPTTPPAVGGPSAPFSSGHGRVTIVHRPTKEARKAEIVAAVTKRLYTQKKKPEPGSAAWTGAWQGVGGRPDYPGTPGAAGMGLPDTNEEAEDDEPKELKLCSNARAKLQEISKRALALHWHRKRRDQEAQTEGPGVLRVKEKACGPEAVQYEDKACQHPHPFYLQPLWALAPGLGLGLEGLAWVRAQRHGDDAFSDDSLEADRAAEPPVPEPPCGTLLQAFTLRSGGRFEAPRTVPRATPAPRIASQSCQTGPEDAPSRSVDVATCIASDAATMTGEEENESATRDAGTMTTDSNDKATMTTQAADASVMTAPEEAPFKDAGTTTTEEDAVSAARERHVGTMTEHHVPLQHGESLDSPQTLLCDVQLSFQPSLASQGSFASPACSYRLAVPAMTTNIRASGQPFPSPHVLSAGQHIPSGATDDRPPVSGKQSTPGARCATPGLKATPTQTPRLPPPDHVPPDIIAEAGSSAGISRLLEGSVAAVVRLPVPLSPRHQQQVFSLEIVQPLHALQPLSLDAHLAPSNTQSTAATARSRSLDQFPVEASLDAGAQPDARSAPAPCEPTASEAGEPPVPENACPPRSKFRLPYLADACTGGPPKPTAIARPVRSCAEPEAPPSKPPSPARNGLTAKQRRLLVNLLNVRPDRRHRAAPSAVQRRRPVPAVSDVHKQAVLQSLSCLIGEAAVYVRTAKDNLNKAPLVSAPPPPAPPTLPPPPEPPSPTPPPPKPLHTSSTETQTERDVETSSKSTQSIADVGAQCSLLAPRGESTRSCASQCALPARTTASASTQSSSQYSMRSWEDGDLSWRDVHVDDDLPLPRKAESVADLCSSSLRLSWRSRSSPSAPRPPPPRWGLGIIRPPELWPRCPRRPPLSCPHQKHYTHVYHRAVLPSPPPCAPSLSSPKQYLRHLVTLRKGVVLASREAEAGWSRGRDDGRATFPS